MKALFDTGADLNVVHQKFVDKYRIPTTRLPRPIKISNVDGTSNRSGQITHRVECDFVVKGNRLPTDFYVSDLGKEDAILGIPFVDQYNPSISDWKKGELKFNPTIVEKQRKLFEHQRTNPPPNGKIWRMKTPEFDVDEEAVIAYTRGEPVIAVFQNEESPVTMDGTHREQGNVPGKASVGKLSKTKGPHMTIGRANISAKLAQKASENKKATTLEELLPEYLHGYKEVFEKKAAERFPGSRPWDHAIDMQPSFVPKDCKVYPLSPKEREELDKFLDENLQKGYIQPSKSPMASPFFFVDKKDGALRPVQDYRYLNSHTVKNAYPLPLISDLLDKLQGAKIFTKLDVRAGYNNIRIKEGDQWKAAFKTPRGLFEPTVMFFGLCNAPATFQAMMNAIFKDMIDEGWIVIYMDDILIFSGNREDHRKRTIRVLERLKEHDLFLKAEKCLFEVEEVEFLGTVIKPGELSMDPVKLQGISEWPTPTTVKQVQSFLGFGNFYRRFIHKYSDLSKPLNELTKKNQKFEWTPACQTAFDNLKQRFQSAPILKMPEPNKQFLIECDASKVATGAVLRQKGDDGLWHPCAYLSKSFTAAERNYEIYDRELLAICRALEAWRHYLQGHSEPVIVWTDHQNLLYFREARKLTR